MSNEKFTQGEWRVARRNVHGITTIFVGVKIGNEYIDVGSANDNEDKANSNLISAAPDMYRALQKVMSYQGEHMEDWLSYECKAALAKADGETK